MAKDDREPARITIFLEGDGSGCRLDNLFPVRGSRKFPRQCRFILTLQGCDL
jgi:hypothetical protein